MADSRLTEPGTLQLMVTPTSEEYCPRWTPTLAGPVYLSKHILPPLVKPRLLLYSYLASFALKLHDHPLGVKLLGTFQCQLPFYSLLNKIKISSPCEYCDCVSDFHKSNQFTLKLLWVRLGKQLFYLGFFTSKKIDICHDMVYLFQDLWGHVMVHLPI